ncbi:MAG: glycosyltransferase family 8 protein [Gammaproteobacteria bacterium]|nr:glycosyltransferase family 8 protein [Thioclava sp.]MBD3756411.1 glycosyltransferase family 8 protein [Gammaproteobacteria bacterium]MBD3801718.1 glycosyltransferase family 8 protein [Thioclava sp.]
MEIDISCSRPAQARKAVAFCCDDAYLPFATHAAAQIAELHPQRDFDICIVSAKPVTLPASLAHLDLRLCNVDPDRYFSGFSTDTRRNLTTYLRLLLPAAFAEIYDRILYLDSDIHIEGGDFSKFLDAKIADFPLAAIRDNPQWRTPDRMPAEFRDFGLANAAYFNAGVLLIDTREWNAQGILDAALAFGKEQGSRLRRNDQTLLNCVLYKNWAEISPIWNWQYTPASRLHEAMVSANIVHFIGPSKPWNARPQTLPPRFGKALRRFCASHFPDRKIDIPDGPGPGTKLMTKMLLRHLVNRKKMARYLARFPDDYTVIT